MKKHSRWKITKIPFTEPKFKGYTIHVRDNHSGLKTQGVLMIDDEDELSMLVASLKDELMDKIKRKELPNG